MFNTHLTETDWSIVAMVAGGFFLSTMSGILGAYHATLLICGAILGMLIGIAIPLIVLFNKQTKIFITAASAGLMSYGAIFCWHYLVSSAYFWMYLCMSSIFGMWWFGAGGAEGGKQVVSWSLWLLGMVLLGTSTRHFGTINVALLVIAFGCRVAVELGLPQRMLGDVMQHLYWHIWLKFFPKYAETPFSLKNILSLSSLALSLSLSLSLSLFLSLSLSLSLSLALVLSRTYVY